MSWKIGLTWYAKWFYQQLHAIMFNVVCLYFQKGEVAYFKYLFPVLQVFYCKCVSCLFKHFTVCSNWQQAKDVVHRSHVKKTSQCCINMSKIEYEKNDLFGTWFIVIVWMFRVIGHAQTQAHAHSVLTWFLQMSPAVSLLLCKAFHAAAWHWFPHNL